MDCGCGSWGYCPHHHSHLGDFLLHHQKEGPRECQRRGTSSSVKNERGNKGKKNI